MTDEELADLRRILDEIEEQLAVADGPKTMGYLRAEDRLQNFWRRLGEPHYDSRRKNQLNRALKADIGSGSMVNLQLSLQLARDYLRDMYGAPQPNEATAQASDTITLQDTTAPDARTLYLERLRVENLKILADQELSFVDAEGNPRLWTVLVGDNGLCKTTILQAIALAASGDKLARALVEDAGDYRNVNNIDAPTTIEADFRVDGPHAETGGQPTKTATMVVEPSRHDFRGERDAADFFDDIRGRRVPGYLVVGFGVGRFLPRPGEVAISDDPLQDRVEGLFNPRHKMLGNDFFDALDKRFGNGFSLQYTATLKDVLLAKDETGAPLLPWLSDVETRGRDGVNQLEKLLRSRRFLIDVGGEPLKLPPTSLSHGYQSMIAWICELLGHGFLNFGKSADPKEMTGVVLLDEIDLHLHPTWQRRVVPVLKRLFPKLQFIVTTHSPLVLTGFEREEIIELGLEGGKVVQRPNAIEPGIMTASEVLTSYFMVPRAARPSLVRKEREYLALKARRDPSDDEKATLQRLEDELGKYWSSLPELDDDDFDDDESPTGPDDNEDTSAGEPSGQAS